MQRQQLNPWDHRHDSLQKSKGPAFDVSDGFYSDRAAVSISGMVLTLFAQSTIAEGAQ